MVLRQFTLIVRQYEEWRRSWVFYSFCTYTGLWRL